MKKKYIHVNKLLMLTEIKKIVSDVQGLGKPPGVKGKVRRVKVRVRIS